MTYQNQFFYGGNKNNIQKSEEFRFFFEKSNTTDTTRITEGLTKIRIFKVSGKNKTYSLWLSDFRVMSGYNNCPLANLYMYMLTS